MTTIALPRIQLPMELINRTLSVAERSQSNPITTHTQDVALLRVLDKLQVPPFTMEAVNAYKLDKLAKARKAAGFFRRKNWSWRMCFARQYMERIPLEVQSLILRIRGEMPETNFAVEYLADRTLHDTNTRIYYPDGTIDPFLYVRVQNHERDRGRDNADERDNWHPIAVWDEPDFKL